MPLRRPGPPGTFLALLIPLFGCSGGGSGASAGPARDAQGSSAALITPADISRRVGQLGARNAAGQDVVESPSGWQRVRIREGFNEVVVARQNPDGTGAVKCVDSEQDAAAFFADESGAGGSQVQ